MKRQQALLMKEQVNTVKFDIPFNLLQHPRWEGDEYTV